MTSCLVPPAPQEDLRNEPIPQLFPGDNDEVLWPALNFPANNGMLDEGIQVLDNIPIGELSVSAHARSSCGHAL